jgi:glycosyltransferase involved in cell wall biosynthesis
LSSRKKIAVLVSNDLSTDQRVRKICETLLSLNLEPILVGRLLPDSLPITRNYQVKRLSLKFNKGPLFYFNLMQAQYNFLKGEPIDAVYANDLDTLLTAYRISKRKGIGVVYDSHEFFTEVPELVNRKFKQKIWRTLEKYLIKKVNAVITVNQSIAKLFEQYYGVSPFIMRNVPMGSTQIKKASLHNLNLPENKRFLLVQGAGINVNRGVEELILSLNYLPEKYQILIIGGGDKLNDLKQLSLSQNLSERVIFKPKMPYEQMMQYTQNAYLGFSLDKPESDNYKYSLPNKIFDYLLAKIPFVCSNLIEPGRVVSQTKAGVIVVSVEPKTIAHTILFLDKNPEKYAVLQKNASENSTTFVWEKESLVIKEALSFLLNGKEN